MVGTKPLELGSNGIRSCVAKAFITTNLMLLCLLITHLHIYYVLVYVDDLIVIGSNSVVIHKSIDLLCATFASRKLEDLKKFLWNGGHKNN